MRNQKSNKKQVRDSISTTKSEQTEKKPITGLGDAIQKITQATGIDKIVKFIAGEDCGCEERRQKLNKMFPSKQPLCLTEEEYQWLTDFRASDSPDLTHEEAKMLSGIYTRVFQFRKIYMPCKCDPKAWQEMVNDLNQIYGTYNN